MKNTQSIKSTTTKNNKFYYDDYDDYYEYCDDFYDY